MIIMNYGGASHPSHGPGAPFKFCIALCVVELRTGFVG
jgi:hypothetical protein